MNVTVTNKKESVIYNGKIYTHGEAFEIEDKIGQSLVSRGFVSLTVDESTDPDAMLDKMSKAELKKLAEEMGLNTEGKKADLIARIAAADADSASAPSGDNDEEDGEDEDEDSNDLPNTDMPV